MRITQLILRDHNGLRVSRIREIEINIDDDTQLIIGSNGSGKSSIMHELFPFPQIKSSFGSHGFKKLCFTHDNHDYILIYEVGKGHLFYKDDVNLNISGTNEIQKDLIKEHLGITNEIHTILKCALPICDMLPSQRKKILMNMNPTDVSIFLSKYQKVHRDVVSYGNNLDRLYTRQKKLMTQRIPEQQYLQMIERKAILENQEKILLVWITSVSNELNNLPVINRSLDIPDDLTTKVTKLFKELHRFNNISRTDYDSVVSRYKTQSEIITQEVSKLEGELSNIIRSLNELESKKELLNQGDSDVSEELSTLILKSKAFSFEAGFNALPEDLFKLTETIISQIQEILLQLTYITYSSIESKDSLNEKYRERVELKSTISGYNNELLQLNKQRDEVTSTLRVYKTGANCDSNSCELLASYQNYQDSYNSRLSNIESQIKDIQDKQSVVHEKSNELFEYLELQESLWVYVNKIISLISSNDMLKYFFPNEYIFNRINESPMLLIDDLNDYLNKSSQFHTFIKIQARIQELEILNASLISKKELSIEVITSEINRKTDDMFNLRNTISSKTDQLKELANNLNILYSFKSVRDQAYNLLGITQRLENEMSINASREYLNKLINILSNLLTQIRAELVDITTVSKEQEMLIVRLDSEVDAVIAELKPIYDKAKYVEKSLYELPIKYTKKFVNAIIETTNYFINEIASYPICLEPIGDDVECDFTFPVTIDGNVLVKDISLCSEGQQAIIKFAFNLAMAIELKFNNFPIFCDEQNRSLDTIHNQRLTDFLLGIISNHIIGQLFVVNHDETMLNKLAYTGNIVVLNSDNIILPNKYNENVKITYY